MPTRPVTVGTSATPIAAYNNKRTALSLFNNSSETIYVSEDQSNIQTRGFPIAVGGELDLIRAFGSEPQIQWYAETASGGANLRVLEEYGELPTLSAPPARRGPLNGET